MTQRSEIEWHKYPDEKPESGKRVLVFGQKKERQPEVYEASLRPTSKRFYSPSNALIQNVRFWTYMPDGPIS